MKLSVFYFNINPMKGIFKLCQESKFGKYGIIRLRAVGKAQL